jgi:hypothetical protein
MEEKYNSTDAEAAAEQSRVDSEMSPRGDAKQDMSPTGDIRPPSKAQIKRYNKILDEIRTDIDLIDNAVARLGRNLQQVRDKRLYFCGGYASFKDFCEKELGKSRQQVHRLIQAYDTITLLMEAGIPEHELPATERLCRAVRDLKEPELEAPVWRAVLRAAKNKGRKPIVSDVKEAAVDIIESPSAIERQQDELLQRFRGAARAFKVGLAFDVMTPSFKLKLLDVLIQVSTAIQITIKALKSPAIDERTVKDGDNGETSITETQIGDE